jgi:hypothetical protein
VELTADIEHRGRFDIGVKFKGGGIRARDLVKERLGKAPLGVRQVGPGKSPDFLGVWLSILVI